MSNSKIWVSLLGAIMLFLFSPQKILAQVVINEIFPNPIGTESGAEWVELFNTTSEVKSLKDCILYLHSTDNNQRVIFNEEAFIDKYEVISWDNSWLNNSGDQVRLVCPGFNDSATYGDLGGPEAPDEGVSVGRNPNGSGSFSILSSVTMGGQNSAPPTPTTAPTNTPTSTPKPTATPKPSSTPTNTPTPRPTRTPTPTSSSDANQDSPIVQGETLGLDVNENNENNENTPTPTPDSEGSGKRFPLMAGAFIVAGVGFIGAAAYPFLRKRLKGYNLKSEENA